MMDIATNAEQICEEAVFEILPLHFCSIVEFLFVAEN